MKILVLGGTRFVGRAFVEAALDRGHQVTLFNRGQSEPDLFKEVPKIYGDRGVSMDSVKDQSFDAVFDSSCYYPRHAQLAEEALNGRIGRYLFISSISVYGMPTVSKLDESAPLADASEEFPEEVTPDNYAPLKVQCERVVTDALGDKSTIVRPGIVVGPHDTTDRFTYWVHRMSIPGEVLVPNVKEQPVQLIDVRDLACWCVDLLERDREGVFNATGPSGSYRFEEVISACWTDPDSERVWVDLPFLEKQGVTPFTDLPLALPSDGKANKLMQANVDKALKAGLSLRPLVETVSDTLVWASGMPTDYKFKAGLDEAREAELIAAWREQ